MAVGSGIGASVGVAPEVTYGTYVAPTRFFEAMSFNVKYLPTYQDVGGVAAGRLGPVDRVVTQRAGSGQIKGDVRRKGFGLMLAHLLGSSATPVQQAATAAYLQTHVLSDPFGKYLTLQGGKPATTGTVTPYTALGSKLTGAEFSCATGGLLDATFDFDCRDLTDAQALAAPSYIAANMPFHFAEMAVKLGTFGSEALVQGVRSASVKIERPVDKERFYAGNAGLKSEPILNDNKKTGVSGSLEVDFVNKADFVDRFFNNTATSLVLEWVGPTAIASTFFPTFRLTMPKVMFTGDIPEVGGPEVLKVTVPFEAYVDTTNGTLTASYMSTDTAI